MPKLVEINGLDEAGRIGDDVLFVRVGIPLPSELEVIIRNVEYFDRLFVGKSLADCVELAKLIVSTTIRRLNYYLDQRMPQNQIPKDVGWPIYIATITQKQFDLTKYERNMETKKIRDV